MAIPVRTGIHFSGNRVNQALPSGHRVSQVKVAVMDSYEDVLERIPSDVSLGCQTIRVYRAPGVQALQIGYSVCPTGEPLETDWRKEWVVIGYEECCGDPIFIDSSADGFPVYTAIHGEGVWEAKQIAVSLEAFGHVLVAIADVAKGRETPLALENNPLTLAEKQATIAAIKHQNPSVSLDFWESVLS